MAIRADFIKYNQWFNDNKSRLESEIQPIIGERFGVYLNENGKFNTFARPEDNEDPL
jgi:hypothetical protein